LAYFDSDFMVNEQSTFEVDGRGKTKKQIQEVEAGSINKIPLWLFGFLY